MINKICLYFMCHVFFNLPLLLLETTTGISLGKQLVVGGDNGVVRNSLDKERHALIHFKAGLEDPDGCLSTWRAEEDDCCKWRGVTCNSQTGHVTMLDLSYGLGGGDHLGGEISPSLLNLSYLNHLDLSYNFFQGTIPTFIGSMTRLRYLNLARNQFNGAIPGSVGYLTRLRHLDLGNNKLNGSIPSSIGSLTELRYLDLSSTYGLILTEFGNLTNLEWLSHLSHLEELHMDGISLAKQNYWVDVILSLRKLSFLSLGGCDLSQVIYPYSSFVNSSSSIQSLSLPNNNLNSSMYHWLFTLTGNKIISLDLSRNMLDGIPKYLGNLCTLEYLVLDQNNAVVKIRDILNSLDGCTSDSLVILEASNSQFTGSVPDDIQKFSSLVQLDLSHNHLNGTISDKLWELPKLQFLDVSSNSLIGVISEKITKSKLWHLDLSNNSIVGVPSETHMPNTFYLADVDLSSCLLGPRFPNWILAQKNITNLNIADNGISGPIPVDVWDNWPSQLRYLNLSSNNISGELPDLSSYFVSKSVIDLSSNSFSGSIPHVPSTLASLNLSRNKFHGGISFLCQIVHGFLSFLDLSHNSLTGQLPDCLWRFKELTVLNLGHNNLSGRIPPSIGSLIKLEALYLYNNDFTGELPSFLKNCTKLIFLNLGANKFYGKVPVWIGENMSGLYALSLRSNNFFGVIPLKLCQLVNLQILDLSMNSLYGTIPRCLNNFTAMVQVFSLESNIHYFGWDNQIGDFASDYISFTYIDNAMIQWQGNIREFSRNLGLLKSIDLSRNNLTGEIPSELTNLYGLLALNLSKNTLLGEIPQKIGQLKELLCLDLSGNNLSGVIPSSMSEMTSLSYLDVSDNILSGRIPSSTQLQSFEPSKYNGNVGLCGPPLTKKCPGDEISNVPTVVGESEGDEEDIDELERWFYIGGGTGFATGFWIVCGTLLLSRRCRSVFFHFLDCFKD